MKMVYALERGSSEHFRLSEGAEMTSQRGRETCSGHKISCRIYDLREWNKLKLLPIGLATFRQFFQRDNSCWWDSEGCARSQQ